MENDKNETPTTEKDQLLPLSDAMDLIDTAFIINSILKTGGNITQSAKELDIGRRTLYDMMEKCGISITNGEITIKLKPIMSNMELRIPYIEKYIS